MQHNTLALKYAEPVEEKNKTTTNIHESLQI